MTSMINDIMTWILIAALMVYIRIIDSGNSDKIDKSRDDIHDLQDYKWSVDDWIHDIRRESKRTRDRVDGLYTGMDTLIEALHMQGIATEVKTEEVKTLVKPEDTDGEDSDN